jgi:hypothetical protein
MSTSIAQGYNSIERVHSIEREREEILSSKEYRDWCKKFNIGSRVHSIDTRATELMEQYSSRYTNWVKSRS